MDIKERIIEQATNMFFDRGIKSIRMDDIASACGISKRTLYESFSDRQELIRLSLWHYIDKYVAEMEVKMSTAENAIEEFWFIFGSGSRFRSRIKNMLRDLMKFYPQIYSEFTKNHRSWAIENFMERLERGQKQGIILRKIDTTLLARNLTSYLYGLDRWFEDVGMEDVDIDANANYVSRPKSFQFSIMLYLRGLTTEKGRKYIDENILIGLE